MMTKLVMRVATVMYWQLCHVTHLLSVLVKDIHLTHVNRALRIDVLQIVIMVFVVIK